MMPYSPNGADSNGSYAEGVFGRGWLQPAISIALRYGLALVTVSVAFVLAQAFLSYGLPLPFTAFALSAIAGTFWYGGTKPGILAALISWLVRDYLFEPEVNAESRILYGLAFLVFALVMILVMRGRNELEARVAERTAELKKANEDLILEIARQKKTEDELRAIMDSAPVFLWSDLPDGYCDFLNQRWLTYFNLSLQEAQGSGWATLLHPDDAAHHLESWQKSIATGMPFETEARFRRPDGEYRWFLNRATPLRDKTGRIVKWYGTNIDIENLKRTERRLRESEAYLAEAQKLSHTGSWAFNATETLYWSEEGYRLWGLDPLQGPPTHDTIWERVHPDDRDKVHEGVQEAIRQKRDYTVEFRILLPDGIVKYLQSCSRHLFSESGDLVGVLGTHTDVTEHKRAEEELRESEYKLRQIIETIPSLVWSADPNFEATHLNQRHLDYYGAQLEDFKRGGWKAFQHPDDLPETVKAISHAAQTGTSFQAVHRIRRADGEFRWHDSRGEPLRDRQGNIIQWYGLTIDIDEAKKAEVQLRRGESYLAEAQRLSHTGTWVLNPTTMQYLYWSNECYRIWGFDPLQGPPSREALWQRILDRDRVWEKVQEALRQKKDYSGEFKIVLPDGTVKYLEATCHHQFSTNGEVVEVIGTNVDVTERKCAEQALRTSEAKIRRLVDANIIGIFIWDFDGRVLEANEAFLNIIGYDREDLVAGSIRWTDLTPPEWRDRDKQLISEHMGTGALQPFEKEYFRKDGSLVPVLIGVATFEEIGNQGVAFVLDLTERKRAEEALRESEYKLRQIIETVPSALWSADPAGEPTHINQRMLDYSGMRLEDFKHGGWQAFVHPDDFPETARTFYRAIQTGTSYQAVNRLRRADGEYRWHHTRGEPLRDQQGRVIQWYGVTVDIDEAKKAEERLRRSETYLAEAQMLSHSGVSAYNETAILYGSEEIYRIWGFDPALGVPSLEAMLQRIHPDDRDRMRAQVQRAVSEKRDYSIAYRIVLPDGAIKHLEAIGRPAFSSTGELIEIVTTQIDVTARKRAEQALRESEGKFRDYAETASDWFWEIGPDYKFTLLTENAFGSDPADRIGTACWEHALDLKTEPEKWRLIRATLDSRKPFRDFVYCSEGRDGSPMYVKGSGKPVFDANGEFRGYRGTGTDVTAIVRAQEEHERLRQLESDLAHMNRLSVMGELTASLAHEIAQPIASARNNARAAVGFLDRSPPDLSEVREALECIVADNDRAGDIIDRIRDQIKKAPPRKGRFDLNKAINEVIVLAQSAITKNGVSVQTRLAEGLSPVQGDRVQLQQVVLNLILNAIEAMSSVEARTRELLISIEQNQTGDVLVAVRDSGPGIDPEHVQRVFEAFYTTKSAGTGMGLSICRSIIDAHGGRLWAEANEPRGAAFQFTWPSAEKELMNSLQAAEQPGEPHEDTASDASHQLAYEGNKPLHRSGRAPDQRHWDRQ